MTQLRILDLRTVDIPGIGKSDSEASEVHNQYEIRAPAPVHTEREEFPAGAVTRTDAGAGESTVTNVGTVRRNERKKNWPSGGVRF